MAERSDWKQAEMSVMCYSGTASSISQPESEWLILFQTRVKHMCNGWDRGVMQFPQYCDAVSCLGTHNLLHSGGPSDSDSLSATRTPSPNVCQPRPHQHTTVKANKVACTVSQGEAENGFGWWKELPGRLDFAVWDLSCVCVDYTHRTNHSGTQH